MTWPTGDDWVKPQGEREALSETSDITTFSREYVIPWGDRTTRPEPGDFPPGESGDQGERVLSIVLPKARGSDGKAHFTVITYVLRRESTGTQLLYTSGPVRKFGKFHYQITERWGVPNEEADSFRESNFGTAHPEFQLGGYTPECTVAEQTLANFRPGMSLMTLFYITKRKPGKAKIRLSFTQDVVRAKEDLDGKIIEGIDPQDIENNRLCTWEVVRGKNFAVNNQPCIITIETAFVGELEAKKIFDLNGKVNDADLVVLERKKGTMLLMGPEFNLLWEENGLWYADYVFLWDPRGHNNTCKTQCTTTIPISMFPFVLQQDGTLAQDKTAKKIIVHKKMPGYLELDADGETVNHVVTGRESTRLIEEGDMSQLDGVIEW